MKYNETSTLERALARNLVNYVVHTIHSRVPETEIEKCAPLRKPLSRELEAVPEQASHSLSAETVSQVESLDIGGTFLDLKDWIQSQQPRPRSKTSSSKNYLSVLRDPMSPSANHVYVAEDKMEEYRSLSWTLSLWMKVDSWTGQGVQWQVIQRRGGIGNGEVNFRLYNQNSQQQYYKYYLGGQEGGTVTMGKWMHLVLVQSASDMQALCYEDGQLISKVTKTPLTWKKAPLVADKNTQSGYFQLADVRFYDSALSQEEIQAIGQEVKITGSTFEFLKVQAPSKTAKSSPPPQEAEEDIAIDGILDVAIADLLENFPEEARDLARMLDEHGLVDALAQYFPPDYIKESVDVDFRASAALADPAEKAARQVNLTLDGMDRGVGAPAAQAESLEKFLSEIKSQREELQSAIRVLRDARPAAAAKVEERLNLQVERVSRSINTIEKELQLLGSISEGFGRSQKILRASAGFGSS